MVIIRELNMYDTLSTTITFKTDKTLVQTNALMF